MPSSEIHALSERIDKVLLEFFDVLDKYYQCQAILDENLKSGNLHMSRARYIRGVTSISSLKITEREMQASTQVQCSGDGLETVFALMSDVSRHHTQTHTTDTLRKRNVGKSSNDGPNVNEDNNENGRQEKMPGDKKSNDKDSNKTKKQKSTCKDPLNWFGVLVPQSLRYSQKNYKSAVDACVELANLQLKMQKLQMQYQELLQEKNVLALAEVKVSSS
ncbi:coiled-coil domain-containing protein 115 isoform X2 [Octopus bimaculoides]|uniref:Vacuolar ATPase assembly protein VMA22 n=2 Tax=Octopus bimaculoides TaxID=37653 RepID=A0A0L8GHX1_OCTBM|nr:coiled-coil domain-containing protein 115 isoform X2 [Octopus bimaculoides]XP_052833043.1 coiled-coil domain-containing protein 115 isoform X2 [Octopus bimaculoides]XP_052833044.1 coiled-coil domain-containing protein 115 isoform X2 [Octopus bimaculoides]XP_052833045.1 coiled-coil domain-containing protein 115 isoform X2 [Octopus bimaculoides]XP_052833046.1 coiled-coil domain-containing protein 115 isoform X2 [Octopus bimaculoides]